MVEGKLNVDGVIGEVLGEYARATEIFGPMLNAHHGFGILKEEVDELWDEVKRHNPNQLEAAKLRMRREAVQVAAMAIRFIIDVTG